MKTNTKKIVGIGLFTAIVVVLQMVASTIKLGTFSITLVLAPMIIGAALYGVGAGAWLGLVFGVTVLVSGDAGTFLAINPVGTVITVLAKGTLAGLAAAGVYKLIEKKNNLVAVIIAGIACPLVNTGVFLIGCCLFFLPTIQGWATAAGIENAGVYMVTSFVGLNFLVELAVNMVLATTIVKVIDIGRKSSKQPA